MTEIFHNNGLSIQVFNVARSSVIAGAAKSQAINLDTPGRFLCAFVTPDTQGIVSGGTGVRNNLNNELTYGQEVSVINAYAVNDEATSQNIGLKVVVYVGY